MNDKLNAAWVWSRAFLAREGQAIRRHPFITAAFLPFFGLLYLLVLIPLTPSIDDIKKARVAAPTVVMSSDGQVLAEFKRVNRERVTLDAISPNVIAALLATEDHRFFEHHGLDLRRTASALLRTLRGDTQGGSTITQQLARNLFPEEVGRAQTINRKLKEAITAAKIESVYSKNDILEMYLNTVPFLYNAYGIEVAAQTYFDKSASELDVLQSATLIGMLKGTAYYNPVINPERSVSRRNTVLAQMVKYDKLKQADYEALKTRPLGLEFERKEEDLGSAPHVASQLKRWLISWADRKGYNIYGDGLVIQTTIDSRLQTFAVDALQRQADKLQVFADNAWARRMGANKPLLQTFIRESGPYRAAREAGMDDAQALAKVQADTDFVQAMWKDKTTLQASFLAMDPTDSQVRAWVGSRDFRQDQFDHVQQARRQPGSTFKPFVYGAAFEQGISPMQTFLDAPVDIRIDAKTVWRPGDVHESSGEQTTLRDALVKSKNTVTAQLMMQVGPAQVAKVARDMGVRESKLDAVPALALGTSPVTLKEMVSAYGTIANNGSYREPILILRVEDSKGTVLEEFHQKPPEQGLQTAAAQTLLDVMRGVIDRGTGAGIRSRFGLQGDLAGKTGTTQDNTDGWFILMHPRLVSGAWVGFNDNRITMGDSWGQGAHNALNIVGDFFQQTVKAKLVDTKAAFAAPKDAGALDKVNDWLNSVFNAQPAEQEPQPMVTADSPQIITIYQNEQGAVTQRQTPVAAEPPQESPLIRVPDYVRPPELPRPQDARSPEIVRLPESLRPPPGPPPVSYGPALSAPGSYGEQR
ncbi:penicillin-binding protein [Caenimonas koreensis DSM 17982]|uniref:Penicillin-binding protein n=1 Tax=Caenimonas koreensis DSM 17982 TaxID=1121255 RepID=A0A844AY57_9BURK|nr:transglycosylase domain-containing protein [Caenimonas koreensis]MRD49480.1 penicillin-binding protein [Caenimonas koreensis DSM 17982]